MKSLTEYLWFSTKKQRHLVNVTEQIERIVERSGVRDGFCLVSAMHITASIWVNDNEPGLWQDFWELVERLAPERPDYKHHLTGEDNGDADRDGDIDVFDTRHILEFAAGITDTLPL